MAVFGRVVDLNGSRIGIRFATKLSFLPGSKLHSIWACQMTSGVSLWRGWPRCSVPTYDRGPHVRPECSPPWIHPYRTIGSDRDHRGPDRPAVAGRAKSPPSRPPDEVPEQLQTDRYRGAPVPRC